MMRATLLRSAVMLAILCLGPSGAGALEKYWITFTDKGPASPGGAHALLSHADERAARIFVSPRALARRAKVLPPGELVTSADLPLHPDYVRSVEQIGGRIVHAVRWMNAVSAYLGDAERAAVERLPFVARVSPVLSLRPPKEAGGEAAEGAPAMTKSSALDYGNSFTQAEMIGAPALHDLGVNGKGVLVGMLDTGVRWRLHEALKTRDIVAEYDFINADSLTENEPGDPASQHNHGTLTFSVIGGYMPGKLIGPAYAAGYVLAKTEDFPTETRVEEDNWAAAIEWMENLGVDVASSSVGYNVFDDNTGYFWSNGDFNGRTSVVALAAVRAARLGVTVCNAMGNEGKGDGVVGTMLTPADADSIISVGAVSFQRYLAGFSSTGPTNDGRTKPDVVAPGVGVAYASPSGISTYSITNGTSLATPLAAGAAALVLSVRPELTPIEVRDILRATADTVDAESYPEVPNEFTGWGLVNAFRAALSFGPVFSNEPTVAVEASLNVITTAVVSKFGITPGSVVLHYAAGDDSAYTAIAMTLETPMLYPASGLYRATIPALPEETPVRFFIEARDEAAHAYESPAPVRAAAWRFRYGFPGLGNELPPPSRTELLPNYPNPFAAKTTIEYRLAEPGFVTCKVYDLLGREVAALVNEQQPAASYTVTWNAAGRPSGVYFCRFTSAASAQTMKLVLVR